MLLLSFVLPLRTHDFNQSVGYSTPPQQEQVDDFQLDVKRIAFHKAYLAFLARAMRWYCSHDCCHIHLSSYTAINDAFVEQILRQLWDKYSLFYWFRN